MCNRLGLGSSGARYLCNFMRLALQLGLLLAGTSTVIAEDHEFTFEEFRDRVEGTSSVGKGDVTYGREGCGIGNHLIALATVVSVAYHEGRPLRRPEAGGPKLKDKVFDKCFQWPLSSPSPLTWGRGAVTIRSDPEEDLSRKLSLVNPQDRITINTCWFYNPAGLSRESVLRAMLSRPSPHSQALLQQKLGDIGWHEKGCVRIGVQIRVGLDNLPTSEFRAKGYHLMAPKQVDCALRSTQHLGSRRCYYFTSDSIADVKRAADAHPLSSAEGNSLVFQEEQRFMHSSEHHMTASEEDAVMADWLVLGEGHVLYTTYTTFGATAAWRTGVNLYKLPYKNYWGCSSRKPVGREPKASPSALEPRGSPTSGQRDVAGLTPPGKSLAVTEGVLRPAPVAKTLRDTVRDHRKRVPGPRSKSRPGTSPLRRGHASKGKRRP